MKLKLRLCVLIHALALLLLSSDVGSGMEDEFSPLPPPSSEAPAPSGAMRKERSKHHGIHPYADDGAANKRTKHCRLRTSPFPAFDWPSSLRIDEHVSFLLITLV